MRYQIESGDTCHWIEHVYKLNSTQLEELNDGLRCENLPVGRRICIWPIYGRSLANMTCKSWKTLETDSNCYDISYHSQLSIDEFRFLNPSLKCDKLIAKGTRVCISGESSFKCALIQVVPPNVTCSQLAQSFSMSHSHLMKLNPTLNCQRLDVTEQVCIGTGHFKPSECTEALRISPELDTCAKVVEQSGLTTEQLVRLNPNLVCNMTSLEWGSLVCITSLGMDTRSAQDIVISKLKELEPELGKKYEEYLGNPNQENANEMNRLITTLITKPTMNSKLKELYRTDPQFRKILDAQHPLPREVYCDQAKKMMEPIKSCICGDDELLIYCQSMAVQHFLSKDESLNSTSLSRRKRSVCSFEFPKTGKGSRAGKLTAVGNVCFGGDCTVPIAIVEIGFEAGICMPFFDTVKEIWTFCDDKGADCHNYKSPNSFDAMKLLVDRSLSAKLKMCAVGSSFVKKLLNADLGLCWEIAAADYFGFVGKLKIGTSIQLIFAKLSGGITMKTHGILLPNLCERTQLECEDYCKWRHWDDRRFYGYFNMHFFAIFGFEGFKVIDENFNEPRGLGCQAGQEAAVVLRNERSCVNEEENYVSRCCWSYDTKPCYWELMEYDKGFRFVPWAPTLFTCEFRIRGQEDKKIGFDVYGGTSGNYGKNSFYYVVKNDGVYYGAVKYKEDRLMKAWPNPCVGKEEVLRRLASAEPTGQSSVSVAGCGKRIVGYYTGWGDRQITEDQLKKLTHVIFAFVAMYRDGSIGFGPVSEDDSGPEAGVKAKRRFLEMRDKARHVNSGVHILFAIGGWDNSQHFASVAADPQKRKRFINAIADFIDRYRLDGVDLDWEYPDMKGADKKNHVLLLKELRERFDQIQKEKSRKSRLLITLASAAGEWNLRDGYDLKGILKYADFINVMTYDYYGAWGSKWGAFTGPPAPLYFGTLKGFSGKLNADFTMKYYTCKTKQPSKLNMGVPFYGRFWKNVQEPIDPSDSMWRTAQGFNATSFLGGYVGWRNLEREGWNKEAASWHEKSKTSFIMNHGARRFLGFESERSLKEKISYATDKNFGGLMIWALDLDDDADTLLNLVSSAGLCSGGSGDEVKYTCVPIDDVRWWTPENADASKLGQCGKSAALINGYYPVCDPDDPGFSCCSSKGHCGSGKEYCECETCKDYRKDPMLIVKEPTKPTRRVQWYSLNDGDGKRGRCGKDVPLLNGEIAICNPDDDSNHCCSNGGYCGTGKVYCECDGCVDYRKQK